MRRGLNTDLLNESGLAKQQQQRAEDITVLTVRLEDVFDLDDTSASGATSKFLQEKEWYFGMLPGDADITNVTIWFWDKTSQTMTAD